MFLDEELSVVDVEEVFGFVNLSNPCFLDPNVTIDLKFPILNLKVMISCDSSPSA